MKTELKTIKPNNVEEIRIMLHGQIGAGKSSFINSVKSVYAERVVVSVLAEANTDHSCTTRYSAQHIQDGNSQLPFVIYDVMGMESDGGKGIHMDDIINALKGHIRADYEFNPNQPLEKTSNWYNAQPLKSERIHCLVSVVSADSISRMTDSNNDVIPTMRLIRKEANKLGIPQIVVLTMPDMACPYVAQNLKYIFKSTEIKKKMEVCSNELGAPMSCILPVMNYHLETKLDDAIDVLVLDAMIHIVQAANDYLWSLQFVGKSD